MEPDLIRTIASPHIRKITFTQSRPYLKSIFTSVGRTYWPKLDDSLRQLADGLKHGLPLDVEFRFSHTTNWTGEPPLEVYLPKIHEKGRVRVVGVQDNTVVYCSDRTS